MSTEDFKEKATLKSFFETGDIPTQPQFGDLIDAFRHMCDGEVIKDFATDLDGNMTITLSDGREIAISANSKLADDSKKLGGIGPDGYVKRNVIEPQAWYENYLIFNSRESGENVGAISMDSEGNSFHFNTDGPRSDKTSNANLHARKFFATEGFFEGEKKLATKEYVDGQGFITGVNWEQVSGKPHFFEARFANGYWGLKLPDEGDENWIRTTQKGIIPFQKDAVVGFGSVGSQGWPFKTIYGQTIYEKGQKLADRYLGKTSRATSAAFALNADKLDNHTSTDFARSNHVHTAAEIGALAVGSTAANSNKLGGSPAADFLKKSGGTMTGNIYMNNQVISWTKNTDQALMGFKNDANSDSDSYMFFRTGDDKNEYFRWEHISRGVVEEWMKLTRVGLTVNGNIVENGDQLSDKYLAVSAKATSASNADKLDGISSESFIRSDSNDSFTGLLAVGSTNKRQAGLYGNYDEKKIAHIWSIGTAYKISQNGSGFGNLCGMAYAHTSNVYGRNMADGHQALWCDNGAPQVSLGRNIWTNGNIYAAGNITAYSDRRLKTNVDAVADNFLDRISQLKPAYYSWKDESKEQSRQLGFIAQEVKELFPEWVHRNGEHYTMSYDKMGAVLAVKGIQELYSEIKSLKAALKLLKDGITS